MKSKAVTLALSLLVMALWGSLYAMVKVGYQTFGMDGSVIPDILMFAGMRFTVCGLLACLFCAVRKEKMKAPKGKTIGMIVFMGFFSILLHYAFTYVGLAFTDGSKTAIMKQIGFLLYICFAFLFFKDEKFSIWKIVGAVVGFAGLIAINITTEGVVFTFGDILLIAASVCSLVSNIISKKSLDGVSPFWTTGISQLFGGVVLLAVSVMMGGQPLRFNLPALLVFAYICVSSLGAYTLWYYLLGKGSLSNLFIVKFAEPLFACIFGAVLLGENIFKWQYLIAFVLICLGIVLGQKGEEQKS